MKKPATKMVSNMVKKCLNVKVIPFLKSAESLLSIGGLKIFLSQFKVPEKTILKILPLKLGFGALRKARR